ncbi:MAG: hypothetical protein N3A02_04530, partial [Rectinema sp.]|nr:hypothetical protein [Rectinema sp.]
RVILDDAFRMLDSDMLIASVRKSADIFLKKYRRNELTKRRREKAAGEENVRQSEAELVHRLRAWLRKEEFPFDAIEMFFSEWPVDRQSNE